MSSLLGCEDRTQERYPRLRFQCTSQHLLTAHLSTCPGLACGMGWHDSGLWKMVADVGVEGVEAVDSGAREWFRSRQCG